MDENTPQSNSGFISLADASKQTGYHQDYLGFLCRTGKLKGFKIGRNWVTTQEALNTFVATTKNGFTEVKDESGSTIQVHNTDDAVSPGVSFSGDSSTVATDKKVNSHAGSTGTSTDVLDDDHFFQKLTENNSVDQAENATAVLQEKMNRPEYALNNLKSAVLGDLETKIQSLNTTVASLEHKVAEAERVAESIEEERHTPLQVVVPPTTNNVFPDLRQKFTPNLHAADFEEGAAVSSSVFTTESVKKLFKTFSKEQKNGRWATVGAIAAGVVTLVVFFAFAKWLTPVNPGLQETKVVYQNNTSIPQTATSTVIEVTNNFSTTTTVVVRENVTTQNIVKTVQADSRFLNSLIDQRLNQYLAEGKFKGDPGQAGPAGPAGPQGLQGGSSGYVPVTYIPSSPTVSNPGTIAGVTYLSAQNLNTQNLTVTGPTTFNTVTYTWPTSQGTNGQILQNDGSGNLSWVTVSGVSGTVDGSGSGGLLARWSDADTLTTGVLMDSGSVAGINATSSSVTFNVQGTAGTIPLHITSSTGASLLVVTQAGNVGIGTSAPIQTLSVNGNAVITGALFDSTNASGTSGMVLQTTGTGTQWVATSSLGISGSLAGGTPGFVARWTSASTLSNGLLLDNATVAGVNATSSSFTFNVQGSSGVNPFNIASSTGSSLLAVTQAGNVGIGTTTPFGTLTLQNDSPSIGFWESDQAANFRRWGLSLASPAMSLSVCNDAGDNCVTAQRWTRGSGINILYTTFPTGNVGIGSTTPTAATLAVLGSGVIDPFDVASSTGVSALRVTATQRVGIGTTSPIATLSVQGTSTAPTVNPFVVASSTGSQLLTVSANGNVGVGTSVPTGLFSVGDGLVVSSAGVINANSIVLSNSTDQVTSPNMLLLRSTLSIGTASNRVVIGNTQLNHTSGTANSFLVSEGFNPTTGSGVWNGLVVNSTVNQGGFASGISRAVHITPSVTRATDFRALEVAAYNYGLSTTALSSLYGSLFNAFTITTTTAATVPSARTLTITGAPIASSSNVTISSSTALTIQGGSVVTNSGTVTNAIGLYVDAPTGAANNFAALFLGGNVGIGTSTPAQTLSVAGNMRLTGALFDGSNASGTLGMLLQSTGTSTQWVATSTLGISGGSVSGGTPGLVARWTSASTLSSGLLIDSGTVAGVNATSSTVTFNVQGTGNGSINPFVVASSTGSALLTVAANGSTTLASLGAGLVRATNSGSLYTDSNTYLTSALTSFSGLTGPAVHVATTSDTNITISISTTTSNTLTFVPGWTGTLAISRGGTGTSAAPSVLGQLLASDGTGWGVSNLVAGSNITITTSTPGSITIATTGLQPAGSYITDTYASNTFVSFGYGTNTFATIANYPSYSYASNTFATLLSTPSYTYGSSTYVNFTYGSSTYQTLANSPTYSYASNTFATIASYPTYSYASSTFVNNTYASSSYATMWNILAGTNITITTSTPGQITIAASGGSVSGGTPGLVARWTSASTLSSGLLIDSGTVAGVNATSSTVTFNVQGSAGINPFSVSSSTGVSLLAITQNGNVGINTSTPDALLTLQGSGSTISRLFNIASSTGASMLRVSWYGGLVQNISSSTAVSIQDGSSNPVFVVDTSNSASNAGIEITAGGSQTGNLLGMYSSGGTFLSGFSYAGGFVQNIASTTAFFLQNGSGSTVFNIDTTSKKVGIGTSTGMAMLDIVSDLSIVEVGNPSMGSSTATGLRVLTSDDDSPSVLIMNTASIPCVGQTSACTGAVAAGGPGILTIQASATTTATSSWSTFNLLTAYSNATRTAASAVFRVRGDGAVFSENAYSASGADYAEYFDTFDTSIEAGDIVVATTTDPKLFIASLTNAGLSSSSSSTIISGLDGTAATSSANTLEKKSPLVSAIMKSGKSYDGNILGIISNQAAFIGNNPGGRSELNQFKKVVGLVGRVPVKVTNENGEVKVGDYVTTSGTKAGYGMKATRSGNILGIALEDFRPSHSTSTSQSSTSTQGTVLVFIQPGWQNIGNHFVIGEGELAGQLASGTTPSAFLINQKGSGNLLQVQKDGMDKFVINNDGVLKILATTSALTKLVVVENAGKEVFSINSVGDLFAAGHITVGKDTAGTATIKAGDNQARITFESPYASVPKIVVTAQGVPTFNFGVSSKNENGFIITSDQPMTADFTFDWIVLEQSQQTASQSENNIQVVNSPSSNTGGTAAPNGTTAADYEDANDIPEGTQVGPSVADGEETPVLPEPEVTVQPVAPSAPTVEESPVSAVDAAPANIP